MTPEDFALYLRAVEARVEDEPVSDALKAIRPVVLEAIKHNFETASNPDGQPWAPRKVTGDGHPLLRDTNALMNAATGGAGSVTNLQPRSMEIGVDKDGGAESLHGAAAHNFGWPEGHLPQREFFGMNDEKLDEAANVLADELLEQFFR